MSATAVAAEKLPRVELVAEPAPVVVPARTVALRLRTAVTLSSLVVMQVVWLSALGYGAYRLVH